ncbi:MAG: hypothetical protein M3O91_01420 [Chloroflexota bacterium]|nr:hypothetical protein [Chloroflexota bacterium]
MARSALQGRMRWALALALIAVSACGPVQATPQSGMKGQVLAGPACPGPARVESPCPDRPVSMKLAMVGSGGSVAETQSSSDGTFSVALPSGHYTVRSSGSGLPSLREVAVDVPAGGYATITLHADTGLR